VTSFPARRMRISRTRHSAGVSRTPSIPEPFSQVTVLAGRSTVSSPGLTSGSASTPAAGQGQSQEQGQSQGQSQGQGQGPRPTTYAPQINKDK
jgi:hypothetical protein